jgi:hypothetical protein
MRCRTPTAIVSVMLANNETGAIQPSPRLPRRRAAAKAFVHTDAVQAFGKIPVDFGELGVNAMSLSAHKIYGPKGAGALIVDKRLDLQPLLAGGGHERGSRSGTENVAAIVGFGAAAELATQMLEAKARASRRCATGSRRPGAARRDDLRRERGTRAEHLLFRAERRRRRDARDPARHGRLRDSERRRVLEPSRWPVARAAGDGHRCGDSGTRGAREPRARQRRGGVDAFLAALDAILKRLQRMAAIAA